MADSKGKKFFEAVKNVNAFRWIFVALYGLSPVKAAGVALIGVTVTFLSIVKALPWPVIAFCLIVTVYLIALFIWAFWKPSIPEAVIVPEAVKEPEVLDLSFTPHGDQSSHLTLEVTSDRTTVMVQAQVRLVSRSDKQPVATSPFLGEWEYEVPIRYSRGNRKLPILRKVRLETGIGRLLEVATWEHDDDHATMKIVGKDAWMMWEHRPTPQENLPFFVLQIEFFGEGLLGSVCKQYKVGPTHAYGPLGMTEVTA